MNTSQFMDKQIMEFSDLLMPKDNQTHQLRVEGILPSYEFQPIRSVESQPPPPLPVNYRLPERHENSKVIHEKLTGLFDMAMVAEIDHAVKWHSDNLLHAIEGISSRLSQLETKTHNLESSVDDLKMSVGDNIGSTDGKLRHLENILKEVQKGVQVLCDKKEVAGFQQLPTSKLQNSTSEHHYLETTSSDPQLHPSLPQQSFQQTSQPPVPPPQHPIHPQHSFQQPSLPSAPPPQHATIPVLPTANAPPLPPQQNASPVQYSAPFHTRIPSVPSLQLQQSFAPLGQPEEISHQQYQAPVQQPQQQQPHQLPPQLPHYSQPQTAQVQPPLSHKPEETPSHMPPNQTYPPLMHPPSVHGQPPSLPPPQQLYGPTSNAYEHLANRPGPVPVPNSAGYGAPPVPGSDSHNYGGSPSHFSGSSSMRPLPFSSSSIPPGRGSSYPRLPTAKLLPQTAPVGPGPSEPTGNRVPIDDVVDKVATMGFSREQVRATVRKLTENGQSVDLNVVLDKLMNGGGW